MGRRVAIIGVFDGVHRGHQAVIAQARALAGDGTVIALTFDPHPLQILAPDTAPLMLSSIDDRVEQLLEAGVDETQIIAFTPELSLQSPRQFILESVVERAQADVVVVGENFRFGRHASGDIQTLRDLGKEFGFDVQPVELRGDGGRYSSTRARTALAEADLLHFVEVLGRPFTYRGTVVHGDRRGRTLGVPTANVEVSAQRAVAADGVYAGWVRVLEGHCPSMPAAISVGSNPHYGGVERRIEAHVIDRDDLDLYDRAIEVGFTRRLRDQQVFDSEADFIAQMQADIAAARAVAGVPESS
ncbi:MAG: riboflavin biosynthesis protein RibF [Candidatus Nanopelagicales bacterium]